MRKTKSLEAALPWLYFKGVSTGEVGDALEVLVAPNVLYLERSCYGHNFSPESDYYYNNLEGWRTCHGPNVTITGPVIVTILGPVN